MAVTTSYSFEFVRSLSSPYLDGRNTATSLANGGVAFAGNAFQTVYDAAGHFFAYSTNSVGNASSISQLSDGNIVTTGTLGADVYFSIMTGTGGPVVQPTGLGSTKGSALVSDVAGGLTGG